MQMILSGSDSQPNGLRAIYAKALREATELYIASAYLTDWDDEQTVGQSCKHLVFLVGTDFGLSRKAAMRSVLRWMPKHGSCQLLAAPRITGGGFHPKVVAWKSKEGRHYALTGSSNLSKAAFGGNYEANVFSVISAAQFRLITKWLDPLVEQSDPISEDWIDNHYREAPLGSGAAGSRPTPSPVKWVLPKGVSYERHVHDRRKQQAAFSEIKGRIALEARRCAEGKLANREFWARFWDTWSKHTSRFQGSGLQFKCKSANWRQACRALTNILEAGRSDSSHEALDAVVTREIDLLAQRENPARGAWLSEILCHYFPALYPIRNAPVNKWLKSNKWRGRRGSSEGQRYVELARKLRHAVESRPAGAQNLAELDAAIWLWVRNRALCGCRGA